MAKPDSIPTKALDVVPDSILAHLQSLPPVTPPEGDVPPVVLPEQELPETSQAIPDEVVLPDAAHVPGWVLA